MALGFYFSPASMSSALYDQCIKALKKAGVHHPVGRTYHSAFGPADKLMVFDIWKSQAAFEKFGKKLMPILQSLGVDPGQPQVMPIHNTIVPPAKGAKKAAPRPAAKKARKAGKKK